MSEEEIPLSIEESFYSRNEDVILLTLISTLTLLIFWILDRVFYCFRKLPPNATINPRRIIPVEEPDPMQPHYEQLANIPDEEKKRREEERKEKIQQVREAQQKQLTEKAQLRSLDQRIAEMERLEKKAKSLHLHLWPRAEQGHVLGKEEEDDDTQMDEDQEIDEIVELHNQIEDAQNQDPEHQKQVMRRFFKLKERIDKKEKEQKASREEMMRIQRAKLEARRVMETAKLEQRLKAMSPKTKKPIVSPATSSSPLEVERQLKKEQDLEFEESLKKDQEKEELVQNEIREQMNKRTRLEIRKTKSMSMMPEPEESEQTCTILIRLPSGRRITRRFYYIDTISSLLDFVDSLLIDNDQDVIDYNVVTHYPKKSISTENGTIEQVLGKEKSHTLFVERP